MKFTSGKWKINKEKYATMIATKDHEICRVNHELTPTKEKAANARLIVKQPERFELLAEAVGGQDYWPLHEYDSSYGCRWCDKQIDLADGNGDNGILDVLQCDNPECFAFRVRQLLKEVEGENHD